MRAVVNNLRLLLLNILKIKKDNSMNTSGNYISKAGLDFTSKNFEITLGDNTLGTLAHELKHAYQFENGAMSTGYKTNGSPFYDKTDEWEAYERGSLFGGERITSLPSLYDNIQDGPKDATQLPPIVLSMPSQLQRIANNTRSAFRVNGITYITEKW